MLAPQAPEAGGSEQRSAAPYASANSSFVPTGTTRKLPEPPAATASHSSSRQLLEPGELQTVEIEKLVHGGQGLGVLRDGRKVFVWNALPGEKVKVELTRSKKNYAEATATEIIKAAPERIEPKELNFLSTSPWQIMNFTTENYWKKQITQELFLQAGVKLPNFIITFQTEAVAPGKAAPVRASESEFSSKGAMEDPPGVFHYRNKMEYSFWGDEDGLHLALYNRGSHLKQIVSGSALAHEALDKAAQAMVVELNKRTVRAGDLKTIIVRSSQDGQATAALYTKLKKFHKMELPNGLKGLRVYHSNPKSPASVRTELLYELGDSTLRDVLLDKPFCYDVDSFFQVNVPVFELVLTRLKEIVGSEELTDMYAGVGSIGLSLAKKSVDLVELDPATAKMTIINAENSGLVASVTQVASEKALDYITPDKTIIFDPPRAGLHVKIIDKLLETLPPKIVYLSCNPTTQARDISLLLPAYKITHFEVFNFFPRTPHIESLAVLELI